MYRQSIKRNKLTLLLRINITSYLLLIRLLVMFMNYLILIQHFYVLGLNTSSIATKKKVSLT